MGLDALQTVTFGTHLRVVDLTSVALDLLVAAPRHVFLLETPDVLNQRKPKLVVCFLHVFLGVLDGRKLVGRAPEVDEGEVALSGAESTRH